MLVARLQLGQPTIGDDWLILSFAAPVIGGVALDRRPRQRRGHRSRGGDRRHHHAGARPASRSIRSSFRSLLGFLILWAVGLNRLREVRVQRSHQEDRVMSEGVLVASNVGKSFPGVIALADVWIRVAPARSTRFSARTAPASRR